MFGIYYRLQQFGFSTAETNCAWILRGKGRFIVMYQQQYPLLTRVMAPLLVSIAVQCTVAIILKNK
jgi:hypothetical protein